MRTAHLDYVLPPEQIAQHPAPERERARLLVLGPGDQVAHRHISDLASVLPAGGLLVLNDTRVVPARLVARKDTGGRVETLLVRRVRAARENGHDVEVWQALCSASKMPKMGVAVRIVDANGDATSLSMRWLGRGEDGLCEVELSTPDTLAVADAVERWGRTPLPPYIKRQAEADDAQRYQTVYARAPGAIAAPTAGLHLSLGMLERLAAGGHAIATVTLHVGLGTFQPVTADDLDLHVMHTEWYEVPEPTARAVRMARAEGRAVVAVGTTVVRALESAAAETGEVAATAGQTSLLIQPGHAFRAVDALLTNFHVPRSTLLALVCAFGRRESVLAAYAAAVREGYRFFSYGDAMFLRRDTTGTA